MAGMQSVLLAACLVGLVIPARSALPVQGTAASAAHAAEQQTKTGLRQTDPGHGYTITAEADIAGRFYSNPVTTTTSQMHLHRVGRLSKLECDFNGDGVKDLITTGSRGTTFVVFGHKGTATPNWNDGVGSSFQAKDAALMPDVWLTSDPVDGQQDHHLDGHNGFLILGVNPSSMACGDINNDGKDDILLGDQQKRTKSAPPNSRYETAGALFVILGSSGGFPAKLSVSDLDGWNGFVVQGFVQGGQFGHSVSTGGDFNGDGILDFAVGSNDRTLHRPQIFILYGSAMSQNPMYEVHSCCHVNKRYETGTSQAPRFNDVFHLWESFGASMEDWPRVVYKPNRNYFGNWYMRGLMVMGAPPQEWGWTSSSVSGYSISIRGDINNDGLADVVIGAPSTTPGTSDSTMAGAVHVLMGRQTNRQCVYSTANDTISPPYSRYSFSSIWGGDAVGVRHGTSKIDSSQAWSAQRNNVGEWLEMDVGDLYSDEKILGVVTQGRVGGWNRQFVTTFKIDTSADGVTYSTLQCNGQDCIFNSGKSANNEKYYSFFEMPAGARLLRIYPQTWESHISMRAGLVVNTCYSSEPDTIYFSGIGSHVYHTGPRNDNAAYNTHCGGGTYYSTLEEAQIECDSDASCEWLLDWSCDGKNWRKCGQKTQMSAGDTMACTRTKGTNSSGFRLSGDQEWDNLGAHVDTSGDIDGDGIKDLVIGAPGADYRVDLIANSITRSRTEYNAGKLYIVKGSSALSSARGDQNLTILAATSIHGIEKNSRVGAVFTTRVDVNTDNKADILIGVPMASMDNQFSMKGGAHIFYGRSSFASGSMSVASLHGTDGRTISGFDLMDLGGFSVSAGDFSGDSTQEVLLGAPSHWLSTRPATPPEVSRQLGSALVLDLNSGISPIPAKDKPLPGPASSNLLSFCECPRDVPNDMYAVCITLEAEGISASEFELHWSRVGQSLGQILQTGYNWVTDVDSTKVLSPPYSQYSFSSTWAGDAVGWRHGASKINSAQAWSAQHNSVGEWLQMDVSDLLQEQAQILGVVTQGRVGGWERQYVTTFKVHTSVDGTDGSFTVIQCGGSDCIFNSGFSGENQLFYSYFSMPQGAQYIRIYPQTWESHMSMRAGVVTRQANNGTTLLHQTVEGPAPERTLYIHTTALMRGQQNASLAKTRFDRTQFQGEEALEIAVRKETELNLRVVGSSGIQACSAVPPKPSVQVGAIPSGFAITGIEFDWRCMSTGCWVIDIIYTRGHQDAVNTFYLPKSNGATPGAYPTTVSDTFLPKNFPCGSDGYDPNNPTWKYTGCCLRQFLDEYRPVGEFEDFLFDPNFDAVCNASAPREAPQSGDVFNVPVAATFGIVKGLNLSVVEDSPMIAPGVFAAKLKIDEWELKNRAGMVDPASSILRTKVETFVGMANFVPTDYSFLDSSASQIRLSLVKGDFFTVGSSGDVEQTFIDYMYMRLHEVKEDPSWLQYVAVTFTLASNFEVNDVTQVVPLTSVRIGKGLTAEDAVWTQACSADSSPAVWESTSLQQEFNTALLKDCAPAPRFCQNQVSIRDNFIAFQIPLGKDYFSTDTDYVAGAKIFVEFVVSVVDKSTNLQSSTTMLAEMPIMPGGTSLWCEAFTASAEMVEIATVDMVIGSAGSEAEISRLPVLQNIDSAGLGEGMGLASYSAASVESGLITLVVKGDPTVFGRTGFSNYGIEMEHLITVHIMESNGLIASTVSSLIQSGEAFTPMVDEIAQTAYLEPTTALLDLCTFTPGTPTISNPIPSPCILRRDADFAKCPVAVAAPCPAMEINPQDTTQASAYFQDLLGDSDYAFNLGANYSKLLSSQYSLNGRYNRAWWINPGMIWNPILAGGSQFMLSQQVMVAALVKLKGSYSPGGTTRRMLFSSGRRAADSPQDVKPGSVAGNIKFTQDNDMASASVDLVSQIWGVAKDTISTWQHVVMLTGAQACMDNVALKEDLQLSLDRLWKDANPSVQRLAVTTATVKLNGVACGARRSSKHFQLRAAESLSDATADVEVAIAMPDSSSELSICAVKSAEHVKSVNKVYSAIQITTDSADCADEEDSGFSLFGLGNTETIIVIAVVGVVGLCGCLICLCLVKKVCMGQKGDKVWPGRGGDSVRRFSGGRYDPSAKYGEMIEVQSNESGESREWSRGQPNQMDMRAH